MIITPAIFPENFEQIVEKLFALEGLCDRVQIDICDGVFGLEKTWLPYKEHTLPDGFEYEFDCMVHDWRKHIPRVIALGAKRVIVHIDFFHEDDFSEMLAIMNLHKIALGLSVSNNVEIHDFVKRVEAIAHMYPKIFVQVMGIQKIGAQGQPFDETCLERIRIIKAVLPQVQVQVDGSMNPETLLKIRQAGADCAVVGSYVFSLGVNPEDIQISLNKLKENYK